MSHRSQPAHCTARREGFCCGPVSLPTGGGEQWCIIEMAFPCPLPTRSHSKDSRRNIFPSIWLVRRTIVKNTLENETNKKIIPKRQGLKTNVSNLESGKDGNEALPPALTMMGKSHFSKRGNNLYSLEEIQ